MWCAFPSRPIGESELESGPVSVITSSNCDVTSGFYYTYIFFSFKDLFMRKEAGGKW